MAVSEYQKKLADPRWLATSRRIKKRDGFKCTCCQETKGLQVHHRYYVARRAPWAYPDFALHTLCDGCHGHAHAEPDEIQEWEQLAAFVIGHGETSHMRHAWDMAVAIQDTVDSGSPRESVWQAIVKGLTGRCRK